MTPPPDDDPAPVSVWPPAPIHTHALEEFSIEGFSVRRADALTVRNPKHRRKFFGILAIQFCGVTLVWMISLLILLNFHRQFGPHGPAWRDPLLRSQMESSTLTCAGILLFWVTFFWLLSSSAAPYGVAVFRSSGTAEVGRRSGRVLSVGIRRRAALRGMTYITTVNMDTHGKPFWNRLRPAFPLASLEDAQKLAVTLAEFMGVPLARTV